MRRRIRFGERSPVRKLISKSESDVRKPHLDRAGLIFSADLADL
jgi:hypothetical protein